MNAQRLFWILVQFDHAVRAAQIAAPFLLFLLALVVGVWCRNEWVGLIVFYPGWWALLKFNEWYDGYSEKLERPKLSKPPVAIEQQHERRS